MLKQDAVERIDAMVHGLEEAAEPAPELGAALQETRA